MAWTALLDGGAETDAIVSETALTAAGLAFEQSEDAAALRAFGGGRVRVIGRATLQLTAAAISDRGPVAVPLPAVTAVVVEGEIAGYDLLIGAKFMRRHAPVTDLRERHWTIDGPRQAGQYRVPLIPAADAMWGRAEAVEAGATGEIDDEVGTYELADIAAVAIEENASELARLGASARPKKRRQPKASGGESGLSGQEKERDRGPCDVEAVAALESAKIEMEMWARHEEDAGRRAREEGEQEEREKDAVAQRWSDQIMGLAEREAGGNIGEEVVRLSPAGVRELAEICRATARQLCDPRRVPRTNAPKLPVQVILDAPGGIPPVRDGTQRQMSDEKQQAAREQLDTLAMGQFVERMSDSRWLHAVVMTKKKDGRWRFAIDYRPLNARLTPQNYPLPDVEGLLRRLAQHRCFSTYDLSDAFYHLELRPDQRAMTGFHVPGRGNYQWRVLPMGVQAATAAWQANVERLFGPLLGHGVDIFVDDMVLYADTPEQLLALTRQVHAIIKQWDLRVSAKKARIFQSKIEFLGRDIEHGKVSIAERQRDAIVKYERPLTVRDMQRFLGLVNYQRRHIPRLGDLLVPLLDIEKAARAAGVRQLTWTEEADEAFNELRRRLAAPPALSMPDMAKLHGRVRIEVDAATESRLRHGGVGGIVSWQDDNGEWQMVGAYSRVLQPPERKYAPVEVEMLAAVKICKEASWLLYKAANVDLVTDHQAITCIGRMAASSHGRLARWAATLLQYDLRLRYRKGADNVAADAMSRAAEGQQMRDLLRGAKELDEVDEVGADADITVELRNIGDSSVDVALVDYPWRHDSDPEERYFRRMDDKRWEELQANRWLRPDAIVFIAVPDCLLPKAMRVVEQHGWQFRRTLQWQRGRSTPSRSWPTCSWEHVVIATRGNWTGLLDADNKGKLNGCINASARQPGRKPDELYNLIEKMVRKDTTKLELFARQQRSGWTCLGDEAELFDNKTDAVGDEQGNKTEPSDNETSAVGSNADGQPTLDDDDNHAVIRGMLDANNDDDDRERSREAMRRHAAVAPPTSSDDEVKRKSIEWLDATDMVGHLMPSTAEPVRQWMRENDKVPLVAIMDENSQVVRWATKEELLRDDHRVAIPVVRQATTGKWVVPKAATGLRDRLIERAHQAAGHPGTKKTALAFKNQGWFLSGPYWSAIKKVCGQCEQCQRRKGHPRARGQDPGTRATMPVVLGYHVHVDHVGPIKGNGKQYWLLSMTDVATRWPECVRVEDVTAETTARTLHREWLTRYGTPRYMTSDRGAAFTAQIIEDMAAMMGIKQLLTTPGHPQANGIEERAHGTLKDTLAIIAGSKDKGGWAEALPAALFMMRATVHDATGHSPAMMVLGHELPLPDLLLRSPTLHDAQQRQQLRLAEHGGDRKEINEWVANRQRDAANVYEQTWGRMRRHLEKAARGQGAATEAPRFRAGDYVRYFCGDDGDEAARWSAPCRVREVVRGVALVLTEGDDPAKQCVQSALRCKAAQLDDERRKYYDGLWTTTQEQLEQQREKAKERIKWQNKDEEEYVVERIVGERQHNGRRQLRVLWRDGDTTWEPYEVIKQDVRHVVEDYEKEKRRVKRMDQGGRESSTTNRRKK